MQAVGVIHVAKCNTATKEEPVIGLVTLDRPVRLSPRLRVLVSTQCVGEPRRSIPVWFKPQGDIDVWTAQRDLARGAAATPAVLRRSRVPASQLGREPFCGSQEELHTFRTRMPVARGVVIFESDMEAAPAVQKGTSVSVSLRQGMVNLQLLGIAAEDGVIGQTVAVLNPASGEQFQAIVTSKNVVEMGER